MLINTKKSIYTHKHIHNMVCSNESERQKRYEYEGDEEIELSRCAHRELLWELCVSLLYFFLISNHCSWMPMCMCGFNAYFNHLKGNLSLFKHFFMFRFWSPHSCCIFSLHCLAFMYVYTNKHTHTHTITHDDRNRINAVYARTTTRATTNYKEMNTNMITELPNLTT